MGRFPTGSTSRLSLRHRGFYACGLVENLPRNTHKFFGGGLFSLHVVTMNVPFKLPFLIRVLAKTATTVTLVNVALVAAWLIPPVTPFIAMAFISTYLYSFMVGGEQWLKGMGKEDGEVVWL